MAHTQLRRRGAGLLAAAPMLTNSCRFISAAVAGEEAVRGGERKKHSYPSFPCRNYLFEGVSRLFRVDFFFSLAVLFCLCLLLSLRSVGY